MSRLDRFAGSALVSDSRRAFLTEPYMVFGTVQLSRVQMAENLVLSPATINRTVTTLRQFGIDTPTKLSRIGMRSLATCEGVGEAALWAASLLVEAGGYDVEKWIDARNESFESAVAHAVKRARRRKYPTPEKRTGKKTRRG